MTENLITICILVAIILFFIIFVFSVNGLIELSNRRQCKKYEKLLSAYPQVKECSDKYNRFDDTYWDKLRILRKMEKEESDLRNKISTSIPEEREEIFKQIKSYIKLIPYLKEDTDNFQKLAREAAQETSLVAKQSLNIKDYKFFCNQGGWQRIESD